MHFKFSFSFQLVFVYNGFLENPKVIIFRLANATRVVRLLLNYYYYFYYYSHLFNNHRRRIISGYAVVRTHVRSNAFFLENNINNNKNTSGPLYR